MIEAQSSAWVPRTVKPTSVLKVFIIQIEDNHGIDIANPKFLQELDFHHRLGLMLTKEHERTRDGTAGEHREIHAIGHHGRAEWKWAPTSYAKPLTFVSRIVVDPRFHAHVKPYKHGMPLAATRQW